MKPKARYGCDPAASRGRRHDENVAALRGPRDAFQRDRDRVIHSIAFRRLRGKTQVFLAPDGDHFRVRLTHSLEVAQIARTIARALGLNEDLTEALSLAHDIGHPPFGHAGEEALKAAMADVGGFDHNAHTIRILTRIERPYPRFDGLNLSWEALEGLAKHNGPVNAPSWAMAEADADYPLDLASWPSLEAQVAAIADDIAYDNHDIDDGIRAGLLTRAQILQVPIIARGWKAAAERFPGIREERQVSELIRSQIGLMVNDLIGETRRRITQAGVETVADVRAVGRALVGFSGVMQAEERALKRFMYAELYHHPRQKEAGAAAATIVSGLFAAYRDDPERLPEGWRQSMPAQEPDRSRHIADFIAGMTDRFAIARYREHVGPIDLPEGF
ncbi:dGTPase [Sphingomonas jejuensis]|uniref:Deoxyguanosinetriphosphate triphosphohydrolase-like protein n=1 Tax=Sphingomonas jejuensis TaxID=904715 RepID=A0ABX0XH55_9SPHN|nr:deoxyguanosinetriphosphate triphosphohydrolase [Sphingomonas jejuensis]NJC32658.1 dGTPase [Sphingomonas jejuensis]